MEPPMKKLLIPLLVLFFAATVSQAQFNGGGSGSVPVGGITGLGTGVATFLATPTSANLATVITNETGSGALVFGTSPTIATPSITGAWSASGLAGTGTLTSGATGAGFTVALGTSTITTGAWTNYTPTVTFSGTCTGSVAGTPTGQYAKLGRIIVFSVQIPIVTAGAACTAVRITVPFTSAAFFQSVVGRDPAGTGVFIGGLISASDTALDIYNYLGAYPAVNGSIFILNGTYQAASD